MNPTAPEADLGRGWPTPTNLHHRTALLASDVLPLCDLLGLLLAVWITAVIHTHTSSGVDVHRHATRAALLAAALAPFLLYDRHFGVLARRAEWLPLLRAQGRQFALCGAVLSVLVLISPELVSAPVDWLASWLGLSFGVTLLNRALLVRKLRQDLLLGGTTQAAAIAGAGRLADQLQAVSPGTLAVPDSFDHRETPRGAPKLQVHYVGEDLAVWLLVDRPIKRWNAVMKATEDLMLGCLLAAALLPLLALTALAIRIDSPGPVLFRQKRHTIDNREFEIFKFRTMHWRAPGLDLELQQTLRNDARVTRVGRVLRKTSLDELPQLFNVLRGDMSLVGPRPHALNMRTENQLGHEITAAYPHRHRMKPGITGWAQINGARGATDTIAQLCRRVELDLHYIDNWSLLLDLRILALTSLELFKRDNAY